MNVKCFFQICTLAINKLTGHFSWFYYRSPNSGDLPYWPQYTHNNSTYLELSDVSNFIVHKNAAFRKEYCELWDDVNSNYMRVP